MWLEFTISGRTDAHLLIQTNEIVSIREYPSDNLGPNTMLIMGGTREIGVNMDYYTFKWLFMNLDILANEPTIKEIKTITTKEIHQWQQKYNKEILEKAKS